MPVAEPRLPDRQEAATRKELTDIVARVREQTDTAYRERIRPIVVQLLDAPDDMPAEERERLEGRLQDELDDLSNRLDSLVDEALALGIATRAIRPLRRFAVEDIQRQVRSLGLDARVASRVDLSDSRLVRNVNRRIQQHASLIKSIPEQHHGRIADAVRRTVDEGRSIGSLTDEIERTGGITRRRAEMIARDQVDTALGEIDRQVQQQVGLDKFIWRSMEDRRVRPTHRILNGNVYTWRTGAPASLEPAKFPGQAIRCRCRGQVYEPEAQRVLGG